jgi:CHAT domain
LALARVNAGGEPAQDARAWQIVQQVSALRAAGRLEEAKALLVDALSQPTADATALRYQRFLLADAARTTQDWPRFFEEVQRLEREPEPSDPTDRSYWSKIGCSLPLLRTAAYSSLGMLDIGAQILQEAERSPCASETRGTLLKLRCQVDMLAYRHERVVKLVDKVLAEEGERPANASAPGAGEPGALEQLHAELKLRKGIALSEAARMGRRDTAEARQVLMEVQRSRVLLGDAVESGNLDRALADLEWRDGNLDAAQAALDSLRASLDATPEPLRGAQADERAQLASYEARLALARGCDDAQARKRLSELEAAFEQLLAAWNRVPHRRGGVGFLHPTNRRAILSELVRLAQRVHGREPGTRRALECLLQAQALGSMARVVGAKACDSRVAERALLGPGHGLLVYLPGADRSHVFAWDASGIVEGTIEAVYTIDEAYGGLAARLSSGVDLGPADQRRQRAEFDALAREFSGRLFPAPIRERLHGWKSVTLVGTELFDGICFEALFIEGIGVLGLERAVDHLPSVPLGVHLARRRPTPALAAASGIGPRLVFVGAPQPSAELAARYAELPRLRLDEAEARALCAPFGADGARIHIGTQATASALRAAFEPTVQVLHVMTHGVFDPQRERGQGLLLAGEAENLGLLWTDDLDDQAGRFAPPELVMLSVCKASRGDVRHGDDGLSHMAGAVLSRGARCVVSSAADLDFAAARELSRAFLERLATGDSVRSARRALADSESYSHPYFWATLIALGDGSRRLR